MVNSSCSVYANTILEVKNYLDKSKQLATWVQASPGGEVQTGFQAYSCTKMADKGIDILIILNSDPDRNNSNSMSIIQIEAGLCPILTGSE